MATQAITEHAAFQFPQSLAAKYQPQTVSQFVGLEKPKKILAKFVENPYPSAWLFVGPSGTGKTSMALAICNALAAEDSFIPGTNFPAWMHRVLRNRFVSNLRRQRPTTDIDDVPASLRESWREEP